MAINKRSIKPRESPTLIPIMALLVKPLVEAWGTAVVIALGEAVGDRVDVRLESVICIGALEVV